MRWRAVWVGTTAENRFTSARGRLGAAGSFAISRRSIRLLQVPSVEAVFSEAFVANADERVYGFAQQLLQMDADEEELDAAAEAMAHDAAIAAEFAAEESSVAYGSIGASSSHGASSSTATLSSTSTAGEAAALAAACINDEAIAAILHEEVREACNAALSSPVSASTAATTASATTSAATTAAAPSSSADTHWVQVKAARGTWHPEGHPGGQGTMVRCHGRHWSQIQAAARDDPCDSALHHPRAGSRVHAWRIRNWGQRCFSRCAMSSMHGS